MTDPSDTRAAIAGGPQPALPAPSKAAWLAAAAAALAAATAMAAAIYLLQAALAAPTGPFDRTPVDGYPHAEAGIVLPPAQPVRDFTAAQVAAALTQVRAALIAGRLDPRMLTSHNPDALIGLLAPDARKGIEADFAHGRFVSYATQLAPGHDLTSDPIRVKGSITFHATTEPTHGIRQLEVVTDFVWVYPFAGRLRTPGDHLVTLHDHILWAVPVDADVEPGSRGLWINSGDVAAVGIDCGPFAHGMLTLGPPARPGRPARQHPAYDPAVPVDEVDTTC